MIHADEPCAPWFTGTRLDNTTRASITLGRDHVVEASLDLLRAGQPLAVDIETHGLTIVKRERIKAVGVGTGSKVVIFDPRDPAQARTLRWLFDEAPALVFHNTAFDVPSLARNGLMSDKAVDKTFDTLIYARMAFPGVRVQKGLAQLAHTQLGHPKPGKDAMAIAFSVEGMNRSEGYDRFDIDRPIYVLGLVSDVVTTALLYPVIRQAAHDRTTVGHPFHDYGVTGPDALRLLDREQEINRIFLRRSTRGLLIDPEHLAAFNAMHKTKLAQVAEDLETVGITPANTPSLMSWCTERGVIDPAAWPKTPTGALSGDKKNLKHLDHPVVRAFLFHKETSKTSRDYLEKIAADDGRVSSGGRIYPEVKVFGADATGRMSIGSPPLQQFPGDARGIILAEPGENLTSIDWSQIEPVVAANLAGDTAILEGYESGDPERDVYKSVAEFAGLTRKQAKVVILADMYGQGLKLLSAQLGVDLDTAQGIKNRVHAAMPIMKNHLNLVRSAAGQAACIPTVSGRIVPIDKFKNEETGRWEVPAYKGVNYHVQGSAYDILAETLIRMDEAGLSDTVYLAMHDELVVCTDAADDVRKIMETPPDVLVHHAKRVPILRTDRADLGERWAYA